MRSVKELLIRRLRAVSRQVRLAPRDYRHLLRMRVKHWIKYHQSEIVLERCYWMGVRALKNPLDAWIYQEVLYEVQPDVLVELGSSEGGSTLYFAHLMDVLEKGTVVSVDIDRSVFKVSHPRVVTVTGNSSAPETVEAVKRLCEGKRVMIIHDADHHKEQVLNDLEAYAPLVSPGSYLIVEDGVVDLFKPGPPFFIEGDGPLRAVEEFLPRHPEFVVDSDRERYLITYNPRGFLKRIA